MRKIFTPSFIARCAAGVVVFAIGIAVISNATKQNPEDCTAKQSYSYADQKCRDKTQRELDQEEYDAWMQSERESLAKRDAAVQSGKNSGSICLNVEEAAQNIGKDMCVVYSVGYLYRTEKGYTFLNEKKGYESRFVAPIFNPNLVSFEYAQENYLGKQIAVSGVISSYEGVPQIKIESLQQITTPTRLYCDTSFGCVYSR